MASIGQIYYNVLDSSTHNRVSNKTAQQMFDDNLVTECGAAQFTKIGIQAPPGTRVVFNEAKTIMIGRTGIYELDENINITHMKFVRPYKYEYDSDASQEYINSGIEKMLEADRIRGEELTAFHNAHPTIPDKDSNPEAYIDYWDEYNEIQSRYITAYQEGLSLYAQGVNGIYKLPNPNNINDPVNFDDLIDVVVDFVYEQGGA